MIRYIKYNFLRGRAYIDIATLNGQSCAWLHRTANAKIHAATKKIPHDEWLIERQHLQPVVGLFSIERTPKQYTVRKDNTIAYKSNFYQLPPGTYQGRGTTVGVKALDSDMVIYEAGNTEITRYQISTGKGKLIGHKNFKRDYSSKIEPLMEQLAKEFEHPELAKNYFEQIRRDNPRYIRGQLLLIRKLINSYGMEVMNPALDFCMKNNILKATGLESLAKKLGAENKPAARGEHPPIEIKTIAPPASKIIPQKSDISDYQNLMD